MECPGSGGGCRETMKSLERQRRERPVTGCLRLGAGRKSAPALWLCTSLLGPKKELRKGLERREMLQALVDTVG